MFQAGNGTMVSPHGCSSSVSLHRHCMLCCWSVSERNLTKNRPFSGCIMKYWFVEEEIFCSEHLRSARSSAALQLNSFPCPQPAPKPASHPSAASLGRLQPCRTDELLCQFIPEQNQVRRKRYCHELELSKHKLCFEIARNEQNGVWSAAAGAPPPCCLPRIVSGLSLWCSCPFLRCKFKRAWQPITFAVLIALTWRVLGPCLPLQDPSLGLSHLPTHQLLSSLLCGFSYLYKHFCLRSTKKPHLSSYHAFLSTGSTGFLSVG